jgi:hypothetical protein
MTYPDQVRPYAPILRFSRGDHGNDEYFLNAHG